VLRSTLVTGKAFSLCCLANGGGRPACITVVCNSGALQGAGQAGSRDGGCPHPGIRAHAVGLPNETRNTCSKQEARAINGWKAGILEVGNCRTDNSSRMQRGVKEGEGLSDVVVVMWLFVLLLFWWVLTMAHDRQAGGPETRAPASPLGSAGVARVALQWPQC